MSIKAKLFVCGQERDLICTDARYIRFTRSNGKPATKLMGGYITVTFQSQMYDDDFIEWIIADRSHKKEIEYPYNLYQLKDGKIVFYKDGIEIFEYNFKDATLIEYREIFDCNFDMRVTLTISAAMQDYRFFTNKTKWNEKSITRHIEFGWQESYVKPKEITKTEVLQDNQPRIGKITWLEKNESTDSTKYGNTVALEIRFINPKKNEKAKITITKQDESKFDENTKELIFEQDASNGSVKIDNIQIKKEWENFKKDDIDKLVAKVEYLGKTKQSEKLEITPNPKVIALFRPHKNWKGEYGFDWIRENDTTLFGDNKYQNIVAKNYADKTHTILQKDSNKYKPAFFKTDPKLFENLKKEYKTFALPWSIKDKNGKQTPENYITPWLSLLPNKKAKITLIAEILEKTDYLEFEENEFFKFTPNKIDIKNKSKIKYKDEINIEIECVKAFATDQTITINAFKKEIENPVVAGKITAWANDQTKQKKKKVVFVQARTKLSKTSREKIPNALLEKTRINQYLQQAFISLDNSSEIIDLDLRTDEDFKKFITAAKSINYTNKKDKITLHSFLKTKLKTDFKDKYKDHFKAFYFAERGGETGTLSGYSQKGKGYVVVFKSANDQTAVHEFLHALNLAHSFANVEADSNATYTYTYKETENLLDYSHHISGHKNSRCALWYWQWVKANNSI